MCFLLGNDFINHLTSLSLRYRGYDYLMETYKMLQERWENTKEKHTYTHAQRYTHAQT